MFLNVVLFVIIVMIIVCLLNYSWIVNRNKILDIYANLY